MKESVMVYILGDKILKDELQDALLVLYKIDGSLKLISMEKRLKELKNKNN